MKEALIFAELLLIISEEEHIQLTDMIHRKNESALQSLIADYIRKYKENLIHLI